MSVEEHEVGKRSTISAAKTRPRLSVGFFAVRIAAAASARADQRLDDRPVGEIEGEEDERGADTAIAMRNDLAGLLAYAVKARGREQRDAEPQDVDPAGRHAEVEEGDLEEQKSERLDERHEQGDDPRRATGIGSSGRGIRGPSPTTRAWSRRRPRRS
jgi:hypothetical protein